MKDWVLNLLLGIVLFACCAREERLLPDGEYHSLYQSAFEGDILEFTIHGDTLTTRDDFGYTRVGNYQLEANQLNIKFKTREFNTSIHTLNGRDSLFVLGDDLWQIRPQQDLKHRQYDRSTDVY